MGAAALTLGEPDADKRSAALSLSPWAANKESIILECA
jgi:hypothetical protein